MSNIFRPTPPAPIVPWYFPAWNPVLDQQPTLNAAEGSFAFTGEAASFAIVLNVSAGAFAFTGIAATFSVTGNFTLFTSPGIFQFVGQSAILIIGGGLPIPNTLNPYGTVPVANVDALDPYNTQIVPLA